MGVSKSVILVHGFFKNASDMQVLKYYLQGKGYRAHAVNLCTTLGTLEECAQALKQEIDRLTTDDNIISLVGHSMGGLIVRYCLSQNSFPNLGRCVLIATPNAGSKLADIAWEFLRFSPLKIPPLNCLRTNCREILPPLNQPLPEIGVIAGNKNNLLLGRFLSAINDGRVEVESVRFSGMKEFIELPFGHQEIHYELETANLVYRFLETGTFISEQ